jgi:hypothetical protein
LKTSTEVGNNEGSAVSIFFLFTFYILEYNSHILFLSACFIQSITARSLNTLGRAETLTANLSFGTTTKKSFNSTFSMPVWNADLLTRLEVQAFGMQRDYRSWASCEEEGGGLRVGFKVWMIFSLFSFSFIWAMII